MATIIIKSESESDCADEQCSCCIHVVQ